MREIIISRKKRIYGADDIPSVIVDGVSVARVINGGTSRVTIDDKEHEIYAICSQIKGNTLQINPGNEDIYLDLGNIYSQFKLTHESINDSYEEHVAPHNSEKKVNWSYICGVVVSFILIILCFSNRDESNNNFIIAIFLSIISGIVIIMGGFWFIVIPLPYIAIWKVGCNKPNQSLARKIILGILSFALPCIVIISLFA